MGISMLKIRRSRDRLIFNMGIPILMRWHLYIETAPCTAPQKWLTYRFAQSSWSAGCFILMSYRHFCVGLFDILVQLSICSKSYRNYFSVVGWKIKHPWYTVQVQQNWPHKLYFCLNTLKPRQIGRLYTDKIFTSNFFSENCLILI